MLLLQYHILSAETLQISYSKNLMASLGNIGSTGYAKNVLVIFVNVTSTYIMTIRKMCECARKLKCFQTNTALKIKLLIRLKIRFLGSLDSSSEFK